MPQGAIRPRRCRASMPRSVMIIAARGARSASRLSASVAAPKSASAPIGVKFHGCGRRRARAATPIAARRTLVRVCMDVILSLGKTVIKVLGRLGAGGVEGAEIVGAGVLAQVERLLR